MLKIIIIKNITTMDVLINIIVTMAMLFTYIGYIGVKI